MHAVDVVLVVDCSSSMRHCFGELREHLKDLLQPLQQGGLEPRFGVVGYSAGNQQGSRYFRFTFMGGAGGSLVGNLYGGQPRAQDYFTTDPAAVAQVLDSLKAGGDEDTLLALDVAVDLPFGPVSSTRRVIAVFTDEPLEAGVSGRENLGLIPALIEKLMARRIQLFVAAPFSEALAELGSADRAEIEAVEGGDGLKSVDFKKLLAQMGKSISVSALQMGSEPAFRRPLFGQERWTVAPDRELGGE